MSTDEKKWSDLTIREQAIPERILAYEEFRRLAACVEQVCLRAPLPDRSSSGVEHNPSRDLVDALGVRGIRAALEYTLSQEIPSERDSDEYLTPSTPMRAPERFSLARDKEVVEWAERFGTQLLAEAYTVLGDDTETMIAQYRAATTAEEQIAVYEWLHERLDSMVPRVDADLGEGETLSAEAREARELMYHPARLSPKMMGIYPDIKIPPTCLGVSIIAASFLRQCDAQIVHAGVMSSMRERDLDTVVRTQRRAITSIIERSGATSLSEALQVKQEKLYDTLVEDRGYHAAVYGKLRDGSWYQIDPNYSCSTRIELDFLVERLDQAYDELHQWHDIAPGLEIAVDLPRSSLADLMMVKYCLDPLEFDLEQQYRVFQLLTDANDESWVQRVYAFAMERLQHVGFAWGQDGAEESFNSALGVLMSPDEDVPASVDLQDTHMSECMYEVIEKHVLADETVAQLKARCRDDEHYLVRKIDDVWALVHMAHVLTVAGMYDMTGGYPISHAAIEVGLPEIRIAMAVLSDFGLYTQAPIPHSFWLSEWDSNVLATMGDLDRQARPSQALIHNVLGWNMAKSLCYHKDYDKVFDAVTSLLETKPTEEVNADGQEA